MSIKVDTPFSDFSPWFESVIAATRPGLIVGIARGAVRFYQLFIDKERRENLTFTSNDGLPFFDDSEIDKASLLLFDDSVIFGSTMGRYKSYLERRGAIVHCCSYIVDRMSFYGEKPKESLATVCASPFAEKMKLIEKKRDWPSRIRLHHGALVHSILGSSYHYNLDFPTFCIKLPSYDFDIIPYLVESIKKTGQFEFICDVSTSLSLANKLPRFSGGLRDIESFDFSADGLILRPYTKARINFIPESGEIRITPIVQLALAESANHKNFNFKERFINDLWHLLLQPNNINDEFYHQSFFRLITAFIGTIIGCQICNKTFPLISTDFPSADLFLDTEDVGIVLTSKNAERLKTIYGEVKCAEPRARVTVSIPTKTDFDPQLPAIKGTLLSAFSSLPKYRPNKDEYLTESIGKVFLALREVVDSSENRLKRPDPARLDTGVTYECIIDLIKENTGSEPSNRDVSLTIDSFVDRGLAVPRIINSNGYWFRAFGFGEDEDDQELLNLKEALRHAYTDYLAIKGSNKLGKFDFQKLCVAMKNVMPWLPISNSPHIFGYTARVGYEQIVDWLTKEYRAPFLFKIDRKRVVLVPNPVYEPATRPVYVSCEHERDFFEGFDYFATCISKVSASAALLLSSCRTQKHAFNAAAMDCYLWASYEDIGFGLVLLKRSINNLYWSLRFVTEVGKKAKLFYRDFPSVLAELERAFSEMGPGGKRWWNYLRNKGLFDPLPDESIEERFKTLMQLLEQMKHLTIYVGKTLIESGIYSEQQLRKVFEEHSASLDWSDFEWYNLYSVDGAATAYNNNIRDNNVPEMSFFRSTLQNVNIEAKTLSQEAVALMLNSAKIAFEETKFCFNQLFPKYQNEESEFPFSPDPIRRVRNNGVIEADKCGTYILALDIIKGTDSYQTNKMKDAISQVLKDFGRFGVIFEDTGNDAFIACCDDVLILRDAGVVIKERGRALINPMERFAGTRKGIFFGSVAVITKLNGETLLRDNRNPNSIPRACYILKGIDDNVEAALRNEKIIVNAETLSLIADKLNLDKSKLSPVLVEAKHFKGFCYILDL